MPLQKGQILKERYRVEALLPEGGMGTVYRATDLVSGSTVAVKENREVTPEAQRQFRREASLLRQLSHPNLPRVTSFFYVPGQGQYLVMDYVGGLDLEQYLGRHGPVPEAKALAWMIQVLDALDYLHSQNPPIIHRDVKPANVKVTADGHIFLVDFGLAKEYDPAKKTTVGARGVTPGYAPPEQYGRGRTDARTDLYSTGATLYALATGFRPPDALELVAGRARLESPRKLGLRLSSRASRAIMRVMRIRPADRFESAVDFRRELAMVLPARDSTVPHPEVAGWAERCRGRLRFLIVLALMIMVCALGIGGAVIYEGQNSTPKPTAGTVNRESGAVHTQNPAPPSTPTGTEMPMPGSTQTPSPVAKLPASTTASSSLTWTPGLTPTLAWTSSPPPTVTWTPSPTPTLTWTPARTPTLTWTATASPSVTQRSVPTDGAEWVRIQDSMTMIHVSAGPFQMGSTQAQIEAALAECPHCIPEWLADERPRHTVHLDAYWIDKTEVSNKQYRQCVEAEACSPPGCWTDPQLSLPDHPVACVTWQDAQSYARWVGGRLPTAAEWEKAARGTDGRIYPWGNVFDGGLVNFCDQNCEHHWRESGANDGYSATGPVGSYPDGASPYGVLDMAGNVWEWVNDWYQADSYWQSEPANPQGPATGENHAVRGGSFRDIRGYTRCAFRGQGERPADEAQYGFRVLVPAESTNP